MAASVRLAGVELYFQDIESARRFYTDALGLPLEELQPNHHAKLAIGEAFLCLERKGVENYPSADKAVVFLEVQDLTATLARIGAQHIARDESRATPPWAAIRDPEGHTVLLLQAPSRQSRGSVNRPAAQ